VEQIANHNPPDKVPFTWEAPDDSLLEDRRGTLPGFPSGVFPPRLTEWLMRASRGAGVMVDAVAVPMIGATSSLIGKARRVQASSSWIEPCTLWTCGVGASGDRKTPGLKVITRALDAIEKENAPIYASASMKHLANAEKAKAELKKWRKECEDAVKDKKEPPQMPINAVDPGAFIHPSLYVADCTVPRLAKLCEVRPRGMMQIRDELAGVFSSMRSAGSRPFYLEAWNGDRFVVERVDGDACFSVENLLVGVIGGIQPDRIASAFAGDQDGLYGRFLFGWPMTPDYSLLTDDINEVDPVFQDLLTKLIRLPDEDGNKKFAPRIIPLSAGARAEFERYRQFVDITKRGIEGRERQWLAKSETHVLRLAGTLAYLSWADEDVSSGTGLENIIAGLEPNEIKTQFMIDATRLMKDYFWPHARAALRQIGLTDRHRHARRVLSWLRSNCQSKISLMDIRRDALSGAVDVEQARDLVNRMVEAGWLRTEQSVATGGRPRERWTVNPLLWPAGTAETAERHQIEGGDHLPAVPAVSAGAEKPKKRRST